MNNFNIFYDDLTELNWFRCLHEFFQNIPSTVIGPRNSNPQIIETLIEYDRPDIILTQGSKALLVIEKTREVPTGHNVGQRVARLVKAVECQVPVIMFLPFEARKHGQYTSVCNLNVRLLSAFEKMWAIHNTPIMAINWQANSDGELLSDGSENNELMNIINAFVADDFMQTSGQFDVVRNNMIVRYNQGLAAYKNYANPPASVKFENTNSFLSSLNFSISQENKNYLLKLSCSVIYKIEMKENKSRREDPYTGNQFLYDYLYCRNGIQVHQKFRNLILYFPNIRKSVWLEKNPNDKNRKSWNWYITATALVFCDGIIVQKLNE